MLTLTGFKKQVLLRVILFVLLLGGGAFYIFKLSSYIIGGLLITLGLFTVISLFRVVNRTNTYLANFLLSIKYDDFETSYTKKTKETSEKALFGAFNLINGKFRNIRLEKEIQFQYFQTMVERVETGLIGFDQDGKTIFMNKALQQILRKSFFPTFNSIEKYDKDLFKLLNELKSGEKKLLKKIISQETSQLAIQKTELKVKDAFYTIYSIHNIYAELQAQEIISWQKLIRILTHEIMNSVSPVVSLADSTHELLKNNDEFDSDDRSELLKAIQAIQRRSEGLLHFTQKYRKLTKIPPPTLEEIEAVEIMQNVLTLMRPIFNQKNIELSANLPNVPITFQGDAEQLEQVFINLLKNAMEALDGCKNRAVHVNVRGLDDKVSFSFKDSGPGIPPELREQIFIPFFTTKTEGSGIGLSLCRQIVYQHGGSIKLYSQEGEGTEFAVEI